MELSLKSEYAILALMELAASYELEQPLQIKQIAHEQNIPDRYLEQLLSNLRRCGIVKSVRGSKGGYILAREPWLINVLEIVQCMEGKDLTFNTEPLDTDHSTSAAVVHRLWLSAQKASASVLKSCTLKDLGEQEKQLKMATAMYYI